MFSWLDGWLVGGFHDADRLAETPMWYQISSGVVFTMGSLLLPGLLLNTGWGKVCGDLGYPCGIAAFIPFPAHLFLARIAVAWGELTSGLSL